MTYSLRLRAPFDDALYGSFRAERFPEGRSKVLIRKARGHVEFTIEANDAVALRSAANSIAKLLAVYERMKDGR